MKNVLSIQSWVAYGHVGNASAVFPMQRLGVEVWAIHTVMFSNHTGYGKWRGPVFPADQVRETFEGIADRGVLDVQCNFGSNIPFQLENAIGCLGYCK